MRKAVIAKEQLRTLLRPTSGFQMKDPITPIFNFSEIVADPKGRVHISVMNSHAGVKRRVPANVTTEKPWRIILSHSQVSFIAGLSGDITLTEVKDKPQMLRVICGTARIDMPLAATMGDSLPFLALPGDDAPSAIVDRDTWLSTGKKLMSITRPDAIKEGRDSLAAVHLMPTFSEACDGRRAVRLPVGLVPQEVAVPAPAWPLMDGLMAGGEGEVKLKLSTDGQYLWLISADGWGAYFRLADGIYPNITQILLTPDENGRIKSGGSMVPTWTTIVDKAALLNAADIIVSAYNIAKTNNDPHPAVSFLMVPGQGLFLRLVVTGNKVDVRIGGAVQQGEDERRFLEQLVLNAANFQSVLAAGFAGDEQVTMRWVGLVDRVVQFENQSGARAMITQVKV